MPIHVARPVVAAVLVLAGRIPDVDLVSLLVGPATCAVLGDSSESVYGGFKSRIVVAFEATTGDVKS